MLDFGPAKDAADALHVRSVPTPVRCKTFPPARFQSLGDLGRVYGLYHAKVLVEGKRTQS